MERHGTQAQCQMELEKCRWRDGIVCPMCVRKGHYVVWHGKAKTFQCQRLRTPDYAHERDHSSFD
jgi:hypothetical protein